jgi:acyl CoA:acetate/3-ketoacid CoA transferase beta subunit
VFDVDKARGTLTLIELRPDTTLDQLRKLTTADFLVSPDLQPLVFDEVAPEAKPQEVAA